MVFLGRCAIQQLVRLVTQVPGSIRLEEGGRAQTVPARLVIQGGAPVTRLRQLTPSRLGIAMFVVVVAVFGSLMGATFASAQPHAAHQALSPRPPPPPLPFPPATRPAPPPAPPPPSPPPLRPPH